MKFQWEPIAEWAARAKVIGGWIVNTWSHANNEVISEALVFIPDPEHKWEITNE